MHPRTRVLRVLAGVLWIAAAWAWPPGVSRAEEPPAAEPGAETVDPAALALLGRFAKALEAEPRFAFAVEFAYDVVQEDGQKLEFGASRVYTVRRPDHLRIDEERRVGGKREFYYDGNRLTVYVPDDKAYALANLKQHRDLGDMIDVVREALDMPVPLGDLLRANPLARIEEGMTSAYVVGRETLGGHACDHVAWRTDEIDGEAWIRANDPPLLQRVVIEYRELPGQPSFRADFTSWSRSPDVDDRVFTFTPASDVERVRFSVRGRGVEPQEVQEP